MSGTFSPPTAFTLTVDTSDGYQPGMQDIADFVLRASVHDATSPEPEMGG